MEGLLSREAPRRWVLQHPFIGVRASPKLTLKPTAFVHTETSRPGIPSIRGSIWTSVFPQTRGKPGALLASGPLPCMLPTCWSHPPENLSPREEVAAHSCRLASLQNGRDPVALMSVKATRSGERMASLQCRRGDREVYSACCVELKSASRPFGWPPCAGVIHIASLNSSSRLPAAYSLQAPL